MSEPKAQSIASIEAARRANAPYVAITPIHDWCGGGLAGRTDAREVVLKLELFQHTGSFKARGAVTAVRALTPMARRLGVTAVSAGNHAIATAFAAAQFGVSAKVVMLASANPMRIAQCRAWGAEVLLAPTGAGAFGLAREIEKNEGRAFIHPFEGPDVALGAGTLGLEFSEQAGALDALVIPIGGGGLAAGVASAFKQLQPGCRIYGVEPAGADTMHRSFAAGSPASRDDVDTIADSLAPPYALPYSYALCRAAVDQLVLVDDDEIRAAMALLFREVKLAVEPAGAVSTAALLGPLRNAFAGQRVGLIVCGANIDIETFARHVARGETQSHGN